MGGKVQDAGPRDGLELHFRRVATEQGGSPPTGSLEKAPESVHFAARAGQRRKRELLAGLGTFLKTEAMSSDSLFADFSRLRGNEAK